MPFKAREIDPAGSARARLGARLRRQRTEQGMSQARLGLLIHSSADQVRRVEATERMPSWEFVVACDRALCADGALTSLWPAVAAERERTKTRTKGNRAATPRPARFSPGASEMLIDIWAASASGSDPGSGTATAGAGLLWVTEQDLVVAQDTLGMFRQLDHAHGAGRFAGHLAAYIDDELAQLLARPAASDLVSRSRGLVAAEFLELAGYQAVDAGQPGGAQHYYQQALNLSARSGDRCYGAYLVAVNLGHLALHCEHPDIALRWARAAGDGVGTAASPATRAAIIAVEARAQARMGEETATTRLLLQAENLLNSAVPQDEPAWIGYFTRAYLADEIAHCLHDLGRAPAARMEVADALEGVGASHVRRLAIDAALLASTWLRSGEVEQACTVAREAVGYAARTSSGRCVQRIAEFMSELAPYAELPAALDLDAYVREVLPAAIAIVPG
ncbi:helix-turn-helix transcriptional regulator [Streptacidiphilus sp. P02-A3a]|uniref:helix-turn-helix domain-containing protein n=1 Tax=Streptacidiphilus sp. P02-A3a TaxID=2704468 RepID=UPI0015FB6FB8|nr:helix-turn-helix transcriptional regulator [Streptacidiphilus sp. P02-A3a]QMU67118.1 helix-turn-helix domain-containing protein [Streptacidiphilus sp. P02-A3a]